MRCSLGFVGNVTYFVTYVKLMLLMLTYVKLMLHSGPFPLPKNSTSKCEVETCAHACHLPDSDGLLALRRRRWRKVRLGTHSYEVPHCPLESEVALIYSSGP